MFEKSILHQTKLIIGKKMCNSYLDYYFFNNDKKLK